MPVYNPGVGAGGGGSAATDTIYDAKGDIVAGTGADTSARVPVGANGLKLKAASAAATGVKWDCGIGTTLPSSPVHGDEYTWVVDGAVNGVAWHMIYEGVTLSKWLFLGGMPMFAQVNTSEGTASTTYAALTTAGPSLTLPAIGAYAVGIGAYFGAGAISATAYMSYDIGGTGAVDADGIPIYSGASANAPAFDNARPINVKAFAAASALVAKYKTSGGTATYANRWMSVTPVRIDPT